MEKGPFGKYPTWEDVPEEEKKFYYYMDKLRPTKSIEWDNIQFNQIWPVRIPKFLHDYHDWWDFWEIQCHLSMQQHLNEDMVLYDVGAFDGWQSAVFSQMVGGPKHMVLIEPVPEMWSNTRETWFQNKLEAPLLSFVGFAANYDTPDGMLWFSAWPGGIDYSQMIKAIKFRLLHEHKDTTPAIRIDTLASHIPPDALHIDVEGAELEVLKGAERTLRDRRPLVWVAVHPQFMIERFNTKPEELYDFMEKLGYLHEHLATDHEEHHFFYTHVTET